MNDLLMEYQEHVAIITLNRPNKANAFDNVLLKALTQQLETAIANPEVRVIVLKANGKHFSAGADANWMQAMVGFSEEENVADALILARLMHLLYHSPKPTLAVVQGYAVGGGGGLVAACDIAIAADSAHFCFSEVKLGLIPAVISPYVVKAIGERATKWLFMSAETIDAVRAHQLNLIQYVIPEAELSSFSSQFAKKLAQLAPQAVKDCKELINTVSNHAIDEALIHKTAFLIAKKRTSLEGQQGLLAFINKKIPSWD